MLGWLKRLFSSSERDPLGPRGENVAARFLRSQGSKIIQRNFTCPVGELDLVAKQGKTLIFVEVKTRADDDPSPETQVDAVKQHQLTKTAR
jgi:putative endonuclease